MAHTHYTAFTVQSGQVTGTQTDFPVLLKPTDNRFKHTGQGAGCHVASTSGYDLRPYSDSALTSAMTYELVPGTYSASTGTFEMWVKVPSLTDSSVIYLGYGDTGLTSDGSSTATWTSNYKLVAHLPDGSSLTVLDSTSNADNGTNNATAAASGKIDGGGAFNGSSAYIDFNGVSMSGGEYTVSFWATRDINAFVMTLNNGTASTVISIDGGNWAGNADAISIFDNGTADNLGSAGSIPDAFSLIHVTFSEDGNIVRGYVNGSQTGTRNSYTDNPFHTAITFGANTNHANNFSSATVDELRMVQSVLSANWIAAEYNNQNAPGTFYSIGSEQTASAVRFFLLGGH